MARNYKYNDEVQLNVFSVQKTTEKAILVTFEDDEGHLFQRWMPKSQIHYDQEDQDLTCPFWLVKEKDLIQCIKSEMK